MIALFVVAPLLVLSAPPAPIDLPSVAVEPAPADSASEAIASETAPVPDSTTETETSLAKDIVTDGTAPATEAVEAPAESLVSPASRTAFEFVGESCGDSETQSVFRNPFLYQVKEVGVVSEPRKLLEACMSYCQYASPDLDEDSPCTGVQVIKNGTCQLHFQEIATGSPVLEEEKDTYLGCYRRTVVPEFVRANFSYIGSNECISMQSRKYTAIATVFNGPWAPMATVTYCSKVCQKNVDCSAFMASDVCKVFMGNVSTAVSKEPSGLSKPFGCYLKTPGTPGISLLAKNKVKEPSLLY